MAGKEGLGRLFDASLGIAPLDLQTARTGNRVSMRNCSTISILVVKGAGTAADDPTFTLQEHTAYTSGTSASLAIIDHYYVKSETTLDGDEQWTKVTQTAAATIADPGGAGTSAEEQQLIVIPVRAEQLSAGYPYISLNCADAGSNAQLGAVVYLLHGLASERSPELLPAPLS